MTDLQNIAREWMEGQRKAAFSPEEEARHRQYLYEMRGGAGCPNCLRWAALLDAERAKVKRLREALEPFAAFREAQQHLGGNHPATGTLYAVASRGGEAEITVEDLEKARAALKDTADA